MTLQKNTLLLLTSMVAISACTGGTTSSSTHTSGASTTSSIAVSQSSASTQSSSGTTPPSNSDLVISEIVAKSGDDTFLAGNDWIELYNKGTSSINLGNFALADSGSAILSLANQTLAPGQYAVVAAVDADDVNPPALSVPFKLGKSDSVTLYYQGAVIDTLSWEEGQADENFSFGWLNNTLQTLQPTPNTANQAVPASTMVPRGNPSGTSALRISEVVPQSDRPTFFEGSDWVELHNTGTSTINLSEYFLADDSSELEALPNISLGANERVVITAGNDVAFGSTANVTFGLGREDSLSLFKQNEEVDYLIWGKDESKNGRSYGYINGQLQALYPTPSETNVAYVLFSENEVFEVHVDVAAQDWQAMLVSPSDEEYYSANFSLNGAKIDDVGFRIKGQGSLMSIRNSIRYGFKVDMNRYVDQKFMGMKKIVFNQSFADPTFMRDTIAYRLMAEAGVPAPQITYVDLYVGAEHMGLYQMIEMIDGEFLEKHFPEDEDDQGDLYKGEIGQRLTWTDNNYATYSSGLRLKSNDETVGTPEEGAAMVSFLNGINNSGAPLDYVDADLTVKFLAASVLLGNMDSPIGATANNFYLYEQRSKGTFTLLPWDYNLSMGLWGNGVATTINPLPDFGGGGGGGGFGDFDFGDFDFGDFDFGGGAPAAPAGVDCQIVDHVLNNPIHDTNSQRPMLDAILQDPALRQQYHAEVQRLMDTVFNEDALRAQINEIASLIDPYVQADPTKFYTYQEWRTALEQGLPDGTDVSDGRGAGFYGPDKGIINFTRDRVNNIRQQLNGQLPISNAGSTACPPVQ